MFGNFRKPMETKNPAKISKVFECTTCNFITNKVFNYKEHLLTRKHKLLQNGNQYQLNSAKPVSKPEKDFICLNCNKKYKNKSGLWKHKKTCINNDECNETETKDINANKITFDKEMFMMLMQQNKELMELLKTNVTNVNANHSYNTNSNNKTFNLQVFLNENCKNAMNINDFIDSIQPTLEDLENVGRVGYAEGISSIIINKLNNMEITKRPIHCSDTKREVTYIKSDDEWNKETDEKPILLNAIKCVANKNISNILEWQKANPGCTQADSRKNDLFLNIVSNSMCGSDKEETNKNFNKIISKISKTVSISDCKI